MMRNTLISWITLSTLLPGIAADHSSIKDSIPPSALVRVLCTRQEFNARVPWQKRKPSEERGYGIAVTSNLVLTTEGLIRNHSLVELMQPRRAEQIPARVIASDFQANLALLEIDTQTLPEPLAPFTLATNMSLDSNLTITQLDDLRQLQTSKATFLRTSVEVLPSAPFPSRVFDVLADQNINGNGAPVLQNGKLAGLVVSYASSTRTATILPTAVLKRFLDDVTKLPYEGFASAGFIWKELVDPSKRQWLGVQNQPGGVLVVSCIPGSGADNVLAPNDVILSWDGQAVDNLGFYKDKTFGRMMFPYLIRGQRHPGDTIAVTIMRDRTEKNIEITLQRPSEKRMLIPANTPGNKAPYLVEGGLVLREMTGRYIHAYGSSWQRRLDSSLVHQYLTRRMHPDRKGERIVLLTQVLPHPINVGYQQIQNMQVTHANGTPIDNMDDLFEIRERDQHIHRVTLGKWGVDIVIEKERIAEANRMLAKTYQIPALYWKGNNGNSIK
ncbi:MAG: PDZ domain-containing protein [Kiritimatiellae bacterium]|nr:PDZ domain-containing protein [Kiritimatiellia bacterium]